MGRNKEGKEILLLRLKPEVRAELGQKLISMGYSYNRGGEKQPAWTAFMEGIATGDIVLYKKV